MTWLNLKKNKVTVVTHSGIFHPDEIFALAIISLYTGRDLDVIRSREPQDFMKGEFVVDVGLAFDPANKKFDHHQKEFKEKHEDGLPMASCGLVWREYGEKLVGSRVGAKMIEDKIICGIDAEDSGIDSFVKIKNVRPYCLFDLIDAFNLTWQEDNAKTSAQNNFLKMVDLAKDILQREIKQVQDFLLAKGILEKIYLETEDKRLIVLDQYYPFKKVISTWTEPLFVVVPSPEGGSWRVLGVKISPDEEFLPRKKMPSSWAGKTDQELVEITGVSDAKFCHKGLFIAGAKSKEGTIKLARLAIENQE